MRMLMKIGLRGVMVVIALLVVGCGKVDNKLPPVVNKTIIKEPLPDFASIQDVSTKKESFFEFLSPLVNEENQHLQSLRDTILAIKQSEVDSGALTTAQLNWIAKVADRYDVENCESFDASCQETLLRRIDVVPPSLVMAQAANESAWGTSRFAKKGNNLFGQWCFSQGCGLVLLQQTSGQHYEVRAFDTVHQSIVSYMMNLNTHASYKELRVIRQSSRAKDKVPSGVELAKGLIHYSERGEEYIDEITKMIRYNDITSYDATLEPIEAASE